MIKRITMRIYGPKEGIRRICVILAATWLAYWLLYAAKLQYELWNAWCLHDCRIEQFAIARAAAIALLGPAGLAVIVRAIHWIHDGFSE